MKKLICILLAFSLMVLLAGCGSSSKNSYVSGESAPSYSVNDGYFEDFDGPGEAPTVADMSTTDVDITKKLIYRASVSAETKDFDTAKSNVDALISRFGGYLESSDISGYSYSDSEGRKSLNYTIRIPANSLDEFLSAMEEAVNVTSSSIDMEDITNSYIDTEARLNALRQEETRLLELLDTAETLEEILQLEDRMSMVRYEIESMTSRLKAYDSDVSYSTVRLSLWDVKEYSSKSSFGSRIGEAFVGGWTSFSDAAQDLVVGIIWALPFLLLIAVIAVVVVVCIKRSNKKRAAKFNAAVTVVPVMPAESMPQPQNMPGGSQDQMPPQ